VAGEILEKGLKGLAVTRFPPLDAKGSTLIAQIEHRKGLNKGKWIQ
jgi:hypothetical protein